MKKTLMRVYNKNDEYSMTGECYFLVLHGTYGELSDEDWHECLGRLSGMSWQNYTSYAIGTAEIEENEMFWSEIMGYEMHEVKIDASRLQDVKKYKLPEEFTFGMY